MTDMDVLEEFLSFPLESADPVFEKFSTIPGAILRQGQERAERFLFIPGTRREKVVLVAHADTFWTEDADPPSKKSKSDIVYENGVIRSKSDRGLGADDRAGCAMVWLLKDLGHSLLITDGEECEQVGSRFLMRDAPDIADILNHHHQFMIQLDRRNGKDYKCYNVGTDEFRNYVHEITKYEEPDRERTTDIRTLCRDICGVNLSIGYYNEHTTKEYLVVSEWQNTLNLCRNWLSKDKIPRFPLT